MFDVLCKKYGSEEDKDLTDLLEDFKDCKLKSKKVDPEDWYAEIEQINEQLEEIDSDFKKTDKEVAAHILANLPKGYTTVSKFIKMGDNYLDDLDKVKKQISKHWKSNLRKKARKDDSSDDSGSQSSSDESDNERTKRKSKDQYALNVNEETQDRRNQYGVLICGHCKKPGHGIANCWELHGRPTHRTNNYKRNNDNRGNDANKSKRRCWNCGSPDHVVANCPNENKDTNDDKDDDEQLNNLFIGTMWQYKRSKTTRKHKCKNHSYETEFTHTKEKSIISSNNKKTEKVNEDSWCKVNGVNKNNKCKNSDCSVNSGSWCKTCSDGESTNSYSSRSMEHEKILKQILGLMRENDSEVNSTSDENNDETVFEIYNIQSEDESDNSGKEDNTPMEESNDNNNEGLGLARKAPADNNDDDKIKHSFMSLHFVVKSCIKKHGH